MAEYASYASIHYTFKEPDKEQ